MVSEQQREVLGCTRSQFIFGEEKKLEDRRSSTVRAGVIGADE